jgi:DnaJ homolog subfamily B member 4
LKTINYTRKGLTGDGKSTEIREETFQVEVKPGYSEETVIKFPTRGHQMHGCQVSALIVRFELEGESDTSYRRNGDDLVYTHQMGLADAMECKPFQVQTLDKRQMKVAMDQMPTPQLQYVVAGEGMPKLGQPGQKGDLTVKFDIVFPEQLTSEKKVALLALLA